MEHLNSIIPHKCSPYLAAGDLPDKKTSIKICSAIVSGLWLDSISPLWGQICAGIIFWWLFIDLFHKMPRGPQILMFSGLIMAVLGEIFCSLIWQLYDYRLFNIPHYVPPGHMLVFLLGSAIAPRMPAWVVWGVPALSSIYVVAGMITNFDRFSAILFLMFLASLISEKDRRLYSTMFLLCLALEIYGTWLGNWTWKPLIPVWELSTPNPPPMSGAFYCILDFLMLRLMLACGLNLDIIIKTWRLLAGSFKYMAPWQKNRANRALLTREAFEKST